MTPIKAKRVAEQVATTDINDLLAAEIALENLRTPEICAAHRKIIDEIDRRQE